MEKSFEHFARLAAVFIFVAACFLVLKPFLTASLLAAVVCVSSWPLYLRLLHRMKDRKNLAALTMTVSLSLVIILPLVLVTYSLTDNVTNIYDEIKLIIQHGPVNPPTWLKEVPLAGEWANKYWHLLATSQPDMNALTQRLLEPAKDFLFTLSIFLGQGIMEMSLAIFISFFLFRDGLVLLRFLNLTLDRIAGVHKENLLDIISKTVRSVMYGLLGTALAQGLVATIGFTIAGVPAPLLFGVVTALVSLIPIGPPIIWIGAAIWLFFQGTIGWGIFMLLWGFFLISMVDNVVKPLLISHGSKLPFILVLLGVMGGVVAFGFVGAFIGPALLAVAYSLLTEWAARDSKT